MSLLVQHHLNKNKNNFNKKETVTKQNTFCAKFKARFLMLRFIFLFVVGI